MCIVELCCPGLMAWSMVEFPSARRFDAIYVQHFQKWSPWQLDEQPDQRRSFCYPFLRLKRIAECKTDPYKF